MDFSDLVEKAGRNLEYCNYPILVLDPGHTTGWAFFEEGKLQFCDQIKTDGFPDAATNLKALFDRFQPAIVVCEDYRVYKWRQKQHVGSELLTTRVIGAIETLCALDPLFIYKVIKQPAHVAKQFCTDKKLKAWGFWSPGKRHANDAIRHGCYYILFGEITDKHKIQNTNEPPPDA